MGPGPGTSREGADPPYEERPPNLRPSELSNFLSPKIGKRRYRKDTQLQKASGGPP